MALMCSYQTLVRYDDSSRKFRARSLDDIRTKARQSLYNLRSHLKSLQMLQHRRTLARFVLEDDASYDDSDSEDADEFPTESIGDSMSQLDYAYNYDEGWSDNVSCNQDRQQSNPSPAWSSTTSCSSVHTITSNESIQLEGRRIRAYFLETPSSARSASPSSSASQSSRKSNGARQPRQHSIHQYKNLNQNSEPHGPSSPKSKHNQSVIHEDFKAFRETLLSQKGDSDNIKILVRENYTALMKATQLTFPGARNDSITLISRLAEQNFIDQDTLLNMLQNGLIFNLQNHLNIGDSIVLVPQVLVNFARSIPSCVPYMIELISSSTILKKFEANLLDGNLKEIKEIINFYHFITELLMSQICNQSHPQPFVPDVLLATGISIQTVESYSSMSTMIKYVSRTLINNVVSRCLDRSIMKDEDLLNKSLMLLAGSLKLAYLKLAEISSTSSSPSADMDWIVQIICGFRDSGIDQQLKLLSGTLERLINVSSSSEHSSQGVDAGPSATRVLVKCQQFSSFYREYYDCVLGACNHLVAKEPPLADRGQFNPWVDEY